MAPGSPLQLHLGAAGSALVIGVAVARPAVAADGLSPAVLGQAVLVVVILAAMAAVIWRHRNRLAASNEAVQRTTGAQQQLLRLLEEEVREAANPVLEWIARQTRSDRCSLAVRDPVHGSMAVRYEWTDEHVPSTAPPSRRLDPVRCPTLIGAALAGDTVLIADTTQLTSGDRLLVDDRCASGIAVVPVTACSTDATEAIVGLLIAETIGRPLHCRRDQIEALQPVMAGLGAATARQHREDELRRLARAVEQSPVSVLITSPDGIIEYVNPRFCETTGYSEEEALGKTPRIVKSDRNDPAVYSELWATIASGDDWRGELINRKRTGELYWEAVSISALKRPDGAISHFIAIKQDITDRKEALAELRRAKDEADRASRAKDEFLANMSHEIRTPVNAIVGMSHLALQTELTERQHDYLTKVRSASQTLLGIINNILDFSRISAGKMVIDSVDFRLDDVLENLAFLLARKAEEKGLELLFDRSDEIPAVLRGDPLRLGQVLLNLGNNAVKFTDTGQVIISTKLLHLDDDHAVLRFAVRDTGIGLSTEQLQAMFQPFAQADGSTTRKFGGTGLGLAVSKRLVEMMGGEIEVHSELGAGSTFEFTTTFGRQRVSPPQRITLPEDLRSAPVLIVDDSRTAAQILAETLEELELQPVLVASSEAALHELARADSAGTPFQAVLMDWNMPGMDGLQAARVIKASTGLGHIPAVLLITAYGREDVIRSADDEVLDGFLLKPVSTTLLADALLAALGRSPRGTTYHGAGAGMASEAHTLLRARVLLVEDNAINQEVASEFLDELGIEVETADDGAQAVVASRRRPFDLILMDVQMPVMDGYQATAEIRRRGLRPDVPIVAMTAHAMSGDRERCLEAGMDDYISKPIDMERLTAVLARWLEHLQPPSERADPAKAPDERPLPELEGVDLTEGLQRLRGNRRLLAKLLRELRHDYKDAIATVRTALDLNHLESARRLVHTLKGVAGTVGAHAVFAAATDLEAAITTGDRSRIRDGVAPLEAALTQLLTSIESVPDIAAPQAAQAKIDSDELAVRFDRLAELLAAGDAEASECLDRISAALGRDHNDLIAELTEHVEGFDYDEALIALGKLRAQLNHGTGAS
jgi:PAS domain S-box-containing protein